MSSSSTIDVKVIPNASRSEISGWVGERLKVKVMAPPDAGRANQEVVEVLAKAVGVASRQVSIIAGERSREKRIMISGVTPEALLARLPQR